MEAGNVSALLTKVRVFLNICIYVSGAETTMNRAVRPRSSQQATPNNHFIDIFSNKNICGGVHSSNTTRCASANVEVSPLVGANADDAMIDPTHPLLTLMTILRRGFSALLDQLAFN